MKASAPPGRLQRIDAGAGNPGLLLIVAAALALTLAEGARRRGMRDVPSNRHQSPRGNQEVARILSGQLVPLLC